MCFLINLDSWGLRAFGIKVVSLIIIARDSKKVGVFLDKF